MVQLPSRFNVADVPESEFELIQPGTYKAMIVESEMKATKGGDGAYLELKIQLEDGRSLKERLNIQNKNETAVMIAYQTLAKICKACNKTSVQNTDELHNIRFMIEVAVEKGKPYKDKDGVEKQGYDQNTIKRYMSLNDAVQSTAAPTAEATATPPWKKK